MKTALLPLLIVLFSALPLCAQEGDDGEPRKARGRVAWFVATTIPEDLENPVDVMIGKEITQVPLSKRSVSEPVKIPASGIIKMVREVPNPEDPGRPIYLTLAQARIPEGMPKALIVLMPAKKSESGLVYHTKVQDLAKFKGGDNLYLNFSPMNVAVQLGETKLGIKPGDFKIYHAPRLTKSTNVPVKYLYFHPKQEKWKMISASTIVLRSTRREICIFSWDPRYERINYHGVTFPVTP